MNYFFLSYLAEDQFLETVVQFLKWRLSGEAGSRSIWDSWRWTTPKEQVVYSGWWSCVLFSLHSLPLINFNLHLSENGQSNTLMCLEGKCKVVLIMGLLSSIILILSSVTFLNNLLRISLLFPFYLNLAEPFITPLLPSSLSPLFFFAFAVAKSYFFFMSINENTTITVNSRLLNVFDVLLQLFNLSEISLSLIWH